VCKQTRLLFTSVQMRQARPGRINKVPTLLYKFSSHDLPSRMIQEVSNERLGCELPHYQYLVSNATKSKGLKRTNHVIVSLFAYLSAEIFMIFEYFVLYSIAACVSSCCMPRLLNDKRLRKRWITSRLSSKLGIKIFASPGLTRQEILCCPQMAYQGRS